MIYKNIILNSLKQTFELIWKSKSLFFLLFVIQIIFFIVFSFISITYQTKILESTKAITEYLSKQKLDESSVASNILQQKNVLGDNPLSISRNFREIVKNFRFYLIYSFVLLVFFISISWTITNRIIHKNNYRKLTKYFLNIFVVLFFYLGLIFYFFFSLVNISFTDIGVDAAKLFTRYIPFLIFSIILAYFMFVSLSLLDNTTLKNIVQKTLRIGIKKAHYILAVYFINIFLFIVAAVLLFYFLEKNLFVLLLSLVLMILSFIFGRIFMVNVVGKLEKI